MRVRLSRTCVLAFRTGTSLFFNRNATELSQFNFLMGYRNIFYYFPLATGKYINAICRVSSAAH